MEVHEALYTTRAMRRVRPDPIPLDAQARILDAAIRAPSGGNSQPWHFVLVDDPAVKARLAPLYHDAITRLWSGPYRPQVETAEARPDAPESVQFRKIQRSANWLGEHFAEVPLFLFPLGRGGGAGSIYPAVWSAMLAARAEGIGACLTSVLGAFHLAETLEVLGVPTDADWTLFGCVSFGYPLGRWGVAERQPVDEVTSRNRWGAAAGLGASGPLWPPPAPG